MKPLIISVRRSIIEGNGILCIVLFSCVFLLGIANSLGFIHITILRSQCIILCTCRCEPATDQRTLCNFIHSPTNYYIVVTNESEAILQSVGVLAQNKNSKCNQFIVFFLCFYLFRNCELHNTSDPSTGWQLSICTNRCSDLKTLSVECIDEYSINALLEMSDNEAIPIFIAWAANFRCSDPSTYGVPGVPIGNTSCDDVSYIDSLLPSKCR